MAVNAVVVLDRFYASSKPNTSRKPTQCQLLVRVQVRVKVRG